MYISTQIKHVTFTIINTLVFGVKSNSDPTISKFIEKNRHLRHNSKDKKRIILFKDQIH